MFLIDKTDAWHSYASRDLIAVAYSLEDAINLCKEQADKESETIDNDQIFNLNNIKQTQGYKGEGEFDIDEVQVNTLF